MVGMVDKKFDCTNSLKLIGFERLKLHLFPEEQCFSLNVIISMNLFACDYIVFTYFLMRGGAKIAQNLSPFPSFSVDFTRFFVERKITMKSPTYFDALPMKIFIFCAD